MISLKKELINEKTTLVKSIRRADAFTQNQDKLKKYLIENFKSHEVLNRESIISPTSLHNIQYYDKRFFDWHRHIWSGRSFSKGFLLDNKKHTFTVKGGHLLEKGKIRDPKIVPLLAPPAWGSESVEQLLTEYKAAEYLQNLSLDAVGKLAPFPIPLKVNALHKYKYENKDIDYRKFMRWIFTSYESHRSNLPRVLIDKNVGVHYTTPEGRTFMKEEYCQFDVLIEKYRETIGDHGSYLYITQGTTMRLADVLSAPTREQMQNMIRSHYPKHMSDEDICRTFMETFGQARGTINASGLMFKPGRISSCYPVDTTIMGNTMDIDGYTYHDGRTLEQFTDIMKHHIVYSETSFFFYSIFFPASVKDFLHFYNTHFVGAYLEYFIDINDYRALQKGMHINPKPRGDVHKVLFDTITSHTATYIEEKIGKEKTSRADAKYLNNFLSKINITI